MELIRGLINIKPKHKNCALTIGNFDGMHLGHQQLLKTLKKNAEKLNLPATVMLFEPQPNEYFLHDNIPPRLMKLREKLKILKQLKIDRVICVRFNEYLADLSAEKFLTDILIEKLGAKYILVGNDFKFGARRKGDFELLKKHATDFKAESMPSFLIDNQRVSSTQVRQALQKGDLNLAQKLLGGSFTMAGRVGHGDKRGRIIGFPTANIYLHRKAVPILGVYAVKVHGIGNKVYLGVANVGNRPTFDGTKSLLEVHIFDFEKDIYGQHVEIEFVHKLRDEKKYASFDLLKQQIFKDAQEAREFFVENVNLF